MVLTLRAGARWLSDHDTYSEKIYIITLESGAYQWWDEVFLVLISKESKLECSFRCCKCPLIDQKTGNHWVTG